MENNKNIWSIVTDVAGKLIGADIAPITPDMSKMPEIPPKPEGGHWGLRMKPDGTYYWEEEKYDEDCELWDTPKTECYPWDLTDDDMKFLMDHKLAKDEVTFKDSLDYYFRGDKHLHIVTDKSTWLSMCGRHWLYDLDSKKLKLIRMN